MERNGWSLFQHPLFKETFETLTREVERLQASDPKGYQAHPKTKLLHTITKHILEVIPGNPNAPEFRQGNTLGKENRHWFPASFQRHRRKFRLHLIVVRSFRAKRGQPIRERERRSATVCSFLAGFTEVPEESRGRLLVRQKGFEPSRYCYRQPLKLVRLPVPPLPRTRYRATNDENDYFGGCCGVVVPAGAGGAAGVVIGAGALTGAGAGPGAPLTSDPGPR